MNRRPRVLYVCVENSCRSQMAEALTRLHAGARVEAFSAGSRPSGVVNPKAVASLAELGYDLSRHESKGLAAFDGQEVDVAVTMGCGDACPLVRAERRVEWDIPDPKAMPSDEFRAVRDLLDARVRALLAELLGGAPGKQD
jgi:protein-tyrosine-phosphatase